MKPKFMKGAMCALLVLMLMITPLMAFASTQPGGTVTPEQRQAQQRHYELWQQNQETPLRVVRIAKLFVVQPDFDDFARLEGYFEAYVFATELLGARVEVVNTIIACNAAIRNDTSVLFTTEVARANELARLFRNVDRDGNPYDLIADRNAGRIDGLVVFSDSYHTAAAGFQSGLRGVESLEMGPWCQYYQGTVTSIGGNPSYEGLDITLPIVILYDNLLHGPTHFLESASQLYGHSWLDMFESLNMTHFGSVEHAQVGWATTNFTDNCADRLRARLGSGPVPANYTNPSNPEFWRDPDHPVFSITGGRANNQVRREMALWNMMRAFGQPGFNADGWPTDPVVWLYGVVPFESYIPGFVEVNGRYYHPDEHDYLYRWLPAIRRGETNVPRYFGVDRAPVAANPNPPSANPPTTGLTLWLQGRNITPSNAPPFINEDGRTMVPLRPISENMDADVSWDRGTSTATITRPGLVITFTAGSNVMRLNGVAVQMDTVPVIIDGYMRVPIRFVAEAFGLTPRHDRDTRQIHLD